MAALEKMWEQGVTHVITTPHFRASTVKQPAEFESQMQRIDDAWRLLADAVRDNFPRMKLDRGVELALDDPSPTVTDGRLRLARTRFALVEFPYFAIPPNSTQPLVHMRASGITPIIAHPERYDDIERRTDILREWKQAGAFLQLNAGSLVGVYGPRVERNGWLCLKMGIVDYISSDYHARGKCLLTGAHERLIARRAATHLKVMSEHNGDRLLEGLDPTPVVPLPASSRWRRFIGAFRRG